MKECRRALPLLREAAASYPDSLKVIGALARCEEGCGDREGRAALIRS